MILQDTKRLVIKVGSALLIDNTSHEIKNNWIETLCADIADLKRDGVEIVIVSSGAIGAGRSVLKQGTKTLRLEEKQAAAAAGQIRLTNIWQEKFVAHEIVLAQILLTPSDTEQRRRHLNARNTIETLLGLGSIPIINENDTVTTEEIRFGDNDRLAARVAQMIIADTLVLLSDIDGLYTADPRKDATAEFIDEVSEITPDIKNMASEAAPGNSSGGMVTKLAAAEIATRAGCQVIIADGRPKHSLARLGLEGRFTRFIPIETSSNARKRWIAGAVSHAGVLTIDEGAVKALGTGGSLLPAGINNVEGSFERGDTVIVSDLKGKRLGCGICAYSASDVRMIAGRKSGDIEELLGYQGRDEIIHRDDLVLED